MSEPTKGALFHGKMAWSGVTYDDRVQLHKAASIVPGSSEADWSKTFWLNVLPEDSIWHTKVFQLDSSRNELMRPVSLAEHNGIIPDFRMEVEMGLGHAMKRESDLDTQMVCGALGPAKLSYLQMSQYQHT